MTLFLELSLSLSFTKMSKLENTSYKLVHEPDAGFIDNCSEFHQSISPIEKEVDKSGSSFLIAFNQGKSRSWTICNQRLTTSCLPLSRLRQGNNKVTAQLENFFRSNLSGTFKNIPRYH